VTALPGPGVTLSGGIFEVLSDGTRRSVSARKVDVQVDVSSVSDPERGGWVAVGSDGHYALSGVPDGRFVKITSVDTIGNPAPSAYRLCGTNTVTAGDTQLNVSLYQPGATLPGPTVSGQISAMIDGRQVPLAGAEIYYQSKGFGPDVWAHSDADGRYSLCGIPSLPGQLYMICGNDIEAYRQQVAIVADTIIDIDATKFYRCL